MKNTFKKYKYILIAISLFVLDFDLTWYFLNYSPHASKGNLLFDLDGGYLALILNAFYIIIIFILEKFFVNKYETQMFDSTNTFDYVKKLMSLDKSSFIFVSFSFAFIMSTLSSRLVAIIDWIVFGIYQGKFYQTKYAILRSKMPLGRFDLVVIILIFIVSLIIWYKLEYKKTKSII